MSQNAYPGPNAGRPAARPASADRAQQPTWAHQQPGHAPQPPQQTGWAQQPAAAPQQPYPPAQQPAAYGQWADYPPQSGAQPGYAAAAPDPYAPQFEPYAPPRAAAYPPQQPAYAPAQAGQWGNARRPDPRGPDPRGYDAGGFGGQQAQQPGHGPAPTLENSYQDTDFGADWHQPQGQAGFGHDNYQQQGGEMGFAQPAGGELDPAFGDEEQEYEMEDVPRGRRPFKIVAALACAILVGGGVAYGYKKISRTGPTGTPPLVKSAAFPAKSLPADAGGKQFPYADSKIMGRLGDGTSSPDSSAPPSAAASSSDSAMDDNGTRKVSTLVVGRDGTIQAPTTTSALPAPAPSSSSDPVSVPGMTLVDAFGGQRDERRNPLAVSNPTPPPNVNFKKVVVNPPARAVADDDASSAPARPVKPIKVAKINSASAADDSTGSIAQESDSTPPPVQRKKKKVAKLASADDSYSAGSSPAPVTSSGGGSGYVAVLASVPKSASSRMDALKRFADMQQKYGSALNGKTPDVAEANLGTKGPYHRLIVGPPGSREQASAVCSSLKSQGYTGCWVTSY